MQTVAICTFAEHPWDKILHRALLMGLSDHYRCFEYKGYPPEEESYDFLFITGIRGALNYGLDGKKLKGQSKILIDFSDHSEDERTNFEDCCFYFIETAKKLFPHYRYLPKFVFDDLLYPEQDDKIITVFVDHYKNNRSYHDVVADQIANCPYPLRILYHGPQGIVENPSEEILRSTHDSKRPDFRFIPFEEIARYYRQSHIFLPTHVESQGMVAPEIGACGGLTLLMPHTYPYRVLQGFPHMLYAEKHPIDWELVRKYISKENKEKFREHVLKHFRFKLFQDSLLEHMRDLLPNSQ